MKKRSDKVYHCSVTCGNCRYTSHKEPIELGTQIHNNPCPNCQCFTLRLADIVNGGQEDGGDEYEIIS